MKGRNWIVIVWYAASVQCMYAQSGLESSLQISPSKNLSHLTSAFHDTVLSDATLHRPVEDGTENRLPATPEINYPRLAIISGGMAALMVGIHIYQQNGWWKNIRAPFNFQEDLQYGLWVDKIGHFYGATLGAYIARKAYEWTNVSDEAALWLGSGTAVLFQTYIEIEDGFSKWGFDRVDFAANTLGALWPIARYYVPPLQNVDVKFSYWPSQNIHKPGNFPGQQHLMMDDYEGQTLWLGLKVNNIFPGSVERYWPDFLGLAVGYAARDVKGQNPYPVVFIGLDYDMTKIIPDDTWFLRMLGEALNFIHLPAPAVRISPSAIWYGLYF